MSDEVATRRTNPARFYEALGRVMGALRDCQALDGAENLDWWAGDGGKTWQIEWREGPFPAEVRQTLLDVAADFGDDIGRDLRGVIEPVGEPRPNDSSYAFLTVLGVPVTLRAIDPIGRDESWRRFTASHLQSQ